MNIAAGRFSDATTALLEAEAHRRIDDALATVAALRKAVR